MSTTLDLTELSDTDLAELIREAQRRIKSNRKKHRTLKTVLGDQAAPIRTPEDGSLTFIYCRVSTDHQQWGIDLQLDACIAYAKQKGLNVGPSWEAVDAASLTIKKEIAKAPRQKRSYAAPDNVRLYVDKGQSGGNKLHKRPAGAALLEHLQRGDTLVVYCLTRLGRSAVDVLNRFEEFVNRGINVHLVNSGGIQLDTSTATGRAISRILIVVAELQRELSRELAVAGQQAAIAAGKYHRHLPPGQLGKQRGSEWDARRGRRVEMIRECHGEKIVCGYLAYWHWVDGISQDEIYCRMRSRHWKWLHKVGKHWARDQNNKVCAGRGIYSMRVVRRAVHDGLKNDWIALARRDMYERGMVLTPDVPPVSAWKREPYFKGESDE